MKVQDINLIALESKINEGRAVTSQMTQNNVKNMQKLATTNKHDGHQAIPSRHHPKPTCQTQKVPV